MLFPFDNLRFFTFDQYRSKDSATIMAIICGTYLPKLRVLCCNYNMRSISRHPELIECKDIQELYKSCDYFRPRSGLFVFINGLLLHPGRKCDACHFPQKLIQFHFYNLQKGFHLRTPLPSVASVDYLDVEDTFLSRTPHGLLVLKNGDRIFQTFYPNLKSIVLNNVDHRQIHPHRLIDFLTACSGLTELELYHADLNADFYERMAELDSLVTLHSLIVLEQLGKFRHELSFDFLQTKLPYLQILHTNVAIRLVMVAILKTMRVGNCYWFDYWITDKTHTRLDVTRTGSSTYELRIRCRWYSEAYREVHREKFNSFILLERFLTEDGRNFRLHHWLDRDNQRLLNRTDDRPAEHSPKSAEYSLARWEPPTKESTRRKDKCWKIM